jgi:two-component system chemotaxis response regulator CheB
MEVVRSGGKYHCRVYEGEPVSGHCPSVDVLFASMAKYVGVNGIGIILTGMGRDGAEGLKTMRDVGAATIGQDRDTSLVYGMPRVAHEAGGVAKQLPIDAISAEIIKICQKTAV